MARPATHSRFSRLGAHFGLKVYELAQYVGVDATLLSRMGTGERGLNQAVFDGLEPFMAALDAATAAPPPPVLEAPERAPLEARLDYCQHHARRLRRELRPLEEQAQQAGHWAAALPALRAALAPDPGPADADRPDIRVSRAAWLNWFRHRWLAIREPALRSDLSARYHLLRLRAEALETEAAALQELLAGPAGPGR
ncbi:hypothetical protein [Hymenobacter jeollabukensis]|uniref:Uncharacterized protein n=1 Tax=Hymenobacter jeollabukensis TaxID=2025313 RepID=A0A5R8WNV0_9BACT|nr:hypothetical protein [Hymenobacter jeollabukensis]TLM91738.1 hypothetical protein FDY95_14345 [Hymenobacter jeollabukensis]